MYALHVKAFYLGKMIKKEYFRCSSAENFTKHAKRKTLMCNNINENIGPSNPIIFKEKGINFKHNLEMIS